MFLLRHTLCSKRGYSYEWKTAKLHNWPKNGKRITCTMDNSVLLVVSRLSSYSSSSLSSTSRSTGQFNYSRKLGTLSDTVTTRSDKHACGKPMLTDHDKQATGNHEPANEMNTEDPTQGILVWFQPSTVNLEDLETHVPAHPSEREGDASKVETQKRKHSDICLRTQNYEGSLQKTHWRTSTSRREVW